MSERRIIYQIDCYDKTPDYVVATKRTVENYARKTGADHLVFTDIAQLSDLSLSACPTPHWFKFGLIPHFVRSNYDKMLYLDLDILVRTDAPDLFEMCNNSVVCSRSDSLFGAPIRPIARIAKKRGLTVLASLLASMEFQINSGLMVFDKQVAAGLLPYLIPPDTSILSCFEQGCLTYKLAESATPIVLLGRDMHSNPRVHETYEKCYFWHLNQATQATINSYYTEHKGTIF